MNLYLRLLLLRLRAKRAPALDLWDTAETPLRVAFTDLDLLRHMNNGKYLSILDVGRMDLLLRSGLWKKLRGRGWYPVVAGQTITYRKSLTLGQRFNLATRILGFDDRWAYVEQVFHAGSSVYAHAVVRTRFLRDSGGSVDHDELADFIGGFPVERMVPDWMQEWTAATQNSPQR
ncbi:acyl-CoA thioesterase [Rothia sp. AR01]|uniref:Acyl-CoA thioesterase n=1 Tax=Rothia santali TaxID=2949643 RepID=A0A9X2KHG1_9MICC|nr:acyl-CoA thioesterase [Rothia santali]MCP3425138.1 acyl-CoA thioesterase [Rothia santali]